MMKKLGLLLILTMGLFLSSGAIATERIVVAEYFTNTS
jgi:hypothetical protein